MNSDKVKKFSKSIICIVMATIILVAGMAIPTAAATPKATQKQMVEGKDGKGAFFGFNYDPNQKIYYAAQNCWQRSFGYNTFYDDMAPSFNMYFECLRFYFNYKGKDWLIQAWKGQYGVTTGAELGIYYKSPDRSSKHYDNVTDADRLPMSITLYHGSEKLFTKPMEKHWWQTGFVLFMQEKSEDLGMVFSIKFKDKAMLKAFKKSITKDMGITYTTKGTTITCKWNMK